MSYEVLRYRPAMLSDLARLQQHLLGPDVARNAAYLKWKYHSNPFIEEPLLYAVVRGSQIVAMRGMFGSCWSDGYGSADIVLPYVDDAVVDPAHRDRGLIPMLMKVAVPDLREMGYDYMVNLSAGPVSFFMLLQEGWRSVGHFAPVSNGAVSPAGSVAGRSGPKRSFRRRLGRLLGGVPGVRETRRRITLRNDRSIISVGSEIHVSDRSRTEQMTELAERARKPGILRQTRDRRYFEWRLKNPYRQYRFLYSGDDQLIDGYTILMSKTSHFSREDETAVVDWAASSDSVFQALLDATLIRNSGRTVAWTATIPPRERTILEDAGFVPGGQRFVPSILIRSTDTALPPADWTLRGLRLTDAASWRISMLDSMHG